MISIARFLSTKKRPDVTAAYHRVISLLLRGVSLHVLEGDQNDFAQFRANLARLENCLTPELPIAEIMVIVGAGLQALEDYNLRTGRFVRMQGIELQKMVAMLTGTIISIASTSEQSGHRLHDIEKQVERAQATEDIQQVKLRLGECLDVIREEAARQRSEATSLLERLQQEAETWPHRMNAARAEEEKDTATGLPRKPQAERTIRDALASPPRHFVVVAVINRFQAITARFGEALGNQVLKRFTEHVQGRLGKSDRVFRWSGPALIALIERPDDVEKVRIEIRRFASARVDSSFVVNGRSVLVPISAAWSVFAAQPPAETLFQHMELFVANQAGRE
jgi:GGDEF domain-containing protein